MTIEVRGPNSPQIDYWNQQAGEKWVALQEIIDAQIRPLGLAAMEAARFVDGEGVVDVGCGCGETTREIARRVGPRGKVTGVDISSVMLRRARTLTDNAGLGNVTYENADAQTFDFPPARADAIFSRFGVMFFAQPDQAFANLAKSLRHGGRLAFVCWQKAFDNAWMAIPMMAALQHLPPLPAPDAPGPFAFADPDKVRRILSSAGFANIKVAAIHQDLTIGGGAGLDASVDFLLQMGPTAQALREADSNLRQTIAVAVRKSLEPYVTPQGVQMGSASWVVTAHLS